VLQAAARETKPDVGEFQDRTTATENGATKGKTYTGVARYGHVARKTNAGATRDGAGESKTSPR